MEKNRSDSVRLVVQPIVLVSLSVGVIWWAFTRDLTATQKENINATRLWTILGQHLLITGAVIAIVLVVAVPLGVLLTRPRTKKLAPLVVGLANLGQAAPAIGLIVLLFLATGRTGFWIGVIPIAAYAVLPVLRNTILGFDEVDPSLIDAARGQGMTNRGVLSKVEFPLAVPYILSGLRTSLILAVSTATLSFLVNAGGLGLLIDTGYRLQDRVSLIVGSVLAVSLALAVDWLGELGEKLLSPKGLTV